MQQKKQRTVAARCLWSTSYPKGTNRWFAFFSAVISKKHPTSQTNEINNIPCYRQLLQSPMQQSIETYGGDDGTK